MIGLICNVGALLDETHNRILIGGQILQHIADIILVLVYIYRFLKNVPCI